MSTPENPTTTEQKYVKTTTRRKHNTEESSVQQWDMDIIISWGLVIMGIISIIGWIAYSVATGNSNGTEIPMSIVSGLTGALAGKHVSKK